MTGLQMRVREPESDTGGALVLLHGRGADENDLFPLFDMLDPERRLLGVCPRGPLSLPPGGAHWYAVYRVGFPDPETFFPTYQRLSGWLDAFLAERGISHDRTVVGGFSQGAVMSYAVSLGPDRPRPAGTIALSGFVPTVDGFDMQLDDLDGYPVAIGHGTHDPIITADFGRSSKQLLEAGGADVTWRESPMPHTIDPGFIDDLVPWVKARLP